MILVVWIKKYDYYNFCGFKWYLQMIVIYIKARGQIKNEIFMSVLAQHRQGEKTQGDWTP